MKKKITTEYEEALKEYERLQKLEKRLKGFEDKEELPTPVTALAISLLAIVFVWTDFRIAITASMVLFSLYSVYKYFKSKK